MFSMGGMPVVLPQNKSTCRRINYLPVREWPGLTSLFNVQVHLIINPLNPFGRVE